MVLPKRSQFYTPTPKAYRDNLWQALEDERFQIEKGFVGLENFLLAAGSGAGTSAVLSVIYPNTELENLGYQPVLDYTSYTYNTYAAPWAAAGRTYPAVCEWNGMLWLSGGLVGPYGAWATSNDLWFSPDGINWLPTPPMPFGARVGHAMFAYNHPVLGYSLWIAGGAADAGFAIYPGDLWYNNTDPTNPGAWVNAGAGIGFLQRAGMNCLVFNNLVWIIRGLGAGPVLLNDVWQTDFWGITAQTATIGDGSALGLGAVFNNKLWISGGIRGFVVYSTNAWTSADGIVWEIDEPLLRYIISSHGGDVTVLNNRLFVSPCSRHAFAWDLWSSPDGRTWINMECPNPVKSAVVNRLVSFNNKLWLFGTVMADNQLQIGLQDIAEIAPVLGPRRSYEGMYLYKLP